MRAPFADRDGLYFKLYREALFAGMGRFFGMQDIQVGDPLSDGEFVPRGNDEEKLRRLLGDDGLKDLLRGQPRVLIEIKDDEGWFGADFPEGVDQLYFCCLGVMKAPRLVKQLFALMLERLVRIDSACEDDPRIRL